MATDQELYEEENIAVLKSISKKLDRTAIISLPESADPDAMKADIIKSVVADVNKKFEANKEDNRRDQEQLKQYVAQQVSEAIEMIGRAIQDNKVTPVTEVTVKNLSDAKQSEVSVKNLSGLEQLVKLLTKAVIDSQPIVNVEKQDVTFPRTPREAIPVRLSDGKGFYNAIMQAVSGGGSETDPLVGYQPSDIDDASSTKYYGFVKASGAW